MLSVDSQNPWTHVRAGVVMGQTIISPVSVTHPVSASKTAALTTARCAKVSDSPQFAPLYLAPLKCICFSS